MVDRLLRCVKAVVDHHIVHHVAAEITGFTIPQDLSLNAAAAVTLWADGEGGRPVSHMVRLQIVDEMASELGTQVLIDLIHRVPFFVGLFAYMATPFCLGDAYARADVFVRNTSFCKQCRLPSKIAKTSILPDLRFAISLDEGNTPIPLRQRLPLWLRTETGAFSFIMV